MTTFAEHQHPRATDGKFAPAARGEATVSLEEPPARRVTVEDAYTWCPSEVHGRLLVEQTRQEIAESGPQLWPEGARADACLETFFPEGTKIIEGAGGADEATLLTFDYDGYRISV